MSNFKDRIKDEYGVVTAFIAMHPKTSVAIAAIVFFCFGMAF